MTKQKEAILRVLHEADAHLTAEQIFLSAKKKLPSLAIATVYRNLNLMADAGEIRRISIVGEADRFDCNPSPHDHLLCEKCGRISDVSIDGLKSELERRVGRSLVSYELTLRYVCPDCAGRE